MQTKPLRSFGMDITESSLQPILNELELKNSDGTDRTVRQLSQAEKQILRYIAVLRQSGEAHGDWANTIEAPANQLKIFKNQAVEASRAFSNLFIGTFGNILPYANAILMVIKEVSNAIAVMMGVEITDYNTGIADMGDAFVDIEDSADSAGNAIKELKRQTLGFDQINNITENKDSGSGNGSLIGGIDQKLLDSIYSYDNGMESVRMKATKIRDQIMQWLGFTKQIDPLTGQVSFKYQGIKTTLKNMWTSFKGLSNTGKILVGLGLVAGATKLYNKGKKILNLLGGTGLVKQASNLLSPLKKLSPLIKDDLAGGFYKLGDSIGESIDMWSKQLTKVDMFKIALVGGAGLLASLDGIKQSLKSVSDEGWNFGNSLGLVASEISAIGSGVYIGSIFGPLGTAIGGVTGALIGLDQIYMNMPTNVTKTNDALKKSHEELQTYLTTLENQEKVIDDSLISSFTIMGAHKNLVSELETLIDVNGKVKKGYEERAEFIVNTLNNAYGLEIEIINGKISNYNNEIEKIKEVIKQKEAEILLDTNREKYAKALQNENQLWHNKEVAIQEANKAQENFNIAQDEYNQAYERWYTATGNGLTIDILATENLKKKKKALNEAREVLNTAKEDEKKYREKYVENQSIIIDYSNLSEAVITGNYDKIKQAIKEYTSTYETESGREQLSLAERIKKTEESLGLMLEKYKDSDEKILNEIKSSYNAISEENSKELMELTTTTKELSDPIIEAWATLGEQNKDKFLEKFGELPESIQTQIVDKMYDKGYSISDELKKGIEQINPEIYIKTKVDKATVEVDADVSKAKTKTNNWLTTLFGGLGSLLGIKATSFKADGGIFSNEKWQNVAQYANGGLPPIGQMFIAREKGPELVGSIGNKTAVMNNNQIVESVKAGVYEAVATAMSQVNFGSGQDIRVYAEEGIIVEKSVRGIQQYVDQTGELPFTVPV